MVGGAVASFSVATAGEVTVEATRVTPERGGAFGFAVTLRHADEGWDHYADRWDVVGPDGTVYGTRTLLHPHTEEQPFTRSQSGIALPEGVREVVVRGHDSIHGDGPGKSVAIPGR
nr:hypothetical protein [Aurantimonas marina]